MASGKRTCDVVVIGAGVFGLTVALAARARGRDVLVLEAASPGAGASGGVVGALSPHVPDQWNPKKAFQLRALLMAPGYWAGIEAETGRSTGFAPVGRLMPLRGSEAVKRAEARAEDAGRNWPAPLRWEVVPPGPLTGALSPEGIDAFVFESLSARLFPRHATAALAAALTARGGRVETGVTVTAVAPGKVSSTKGAYDTDKVVLAAGVAGFPLLAPLLGGATVGQGVKGQAALLAADLPHGTPVIFDDGLYIIDHGQSRVAIGSTSETAYTAPDTTDEALEALITRARKICPALRAAPVLDRWAGVRPKARRRDPMLGPVPGAAGVFAAMGGFKIGFGIAPLVGDVLADMLDGVPAELPDSFTVANHLH